MASERSHRWPIASCFLENSSGSSSSKDAKKAQAFYGEVLGWKVQPFPMGDSTYEMIYAAETMIGGYAPFKTGGQPSHWISYVSVEDVDATVKAAVANGGKVVEAPYDIPGVGRTARIADPQGASCAPSGATRVIPPTRWRPAVAGAGMSCTPAIRRKRSRSTRRSSGSRTALWSGRTSRTTSSRRAASTAAE